MASPSKDTLISLVSRRKTGIKRTAARTTGGSCASAPLFRVREAKMRARSDLKRKSLRARMRATTRAACAGTRVNHSTYGGWLGGCAPRPCGREGERERERERKGEKEGGAENRQQVRTADPPNVWSYLGEGEMCPRGRRRMEGCGGV